ncbi:MAG TPA: sodium:solute symporter [Terriglobales bacterium]|nr:sodium:solute symporter [Terriglobales bacterium]
MPPAAYRNRSPMALRPLDLLIVALYLAGITAFGVRFRKPRRTLRDYFLADRNVPWWAIALSIVATETSTLTIISIPGLAYDTNLGFLQVALGYCVGRVVISFVLLPLYFRGELFTAYQLIERRFGPSLRSLTAGMFLLTRAAADGVRIWAVSMVVMLAIGTGEVASVALITVLTLIYTLEGGLAAVIWTDVVQLFIYLGGTLAGLFLILAAVPGGWDAIVELGSLNSKWQALDFSWSFATPYTFWAGVIGGGFLTTASHGTDQLMVQRLLAARGLRESRLALLSSGVVILLQFALFLVIGVALFAFYRLAEPSTHFAKSDLVFPTFIVQHMPPGVAGLLIAAILAAAMSTLSSSLSSLASTTVVDFLLRRRPQADEQHRIGLSRRITFVWAIVLFAVALLSRRGGRVVEVGLAIASVAYGALLGVFLLGALTRVAHSRGAAVGMAAGLAVNVYAWLWTVLPWTWYVPLGTIVTFVTGYAASVVLNRNGEARA